MCQSRGDIWKECRTLLSSAFDPLYRENSTGGGVCDGGRDRLGEMMRLSLLRLPVLLVIYGDV